MAVYTTLSAGELSELIGHYDVGELISAQGIAEGNVNKQIARLLDISIKTVESHRAAAMRKAGVRTAAEFVRFAIKHNLIQA